jgi:hypothetical protein
LWSGLGCWHAGRRFGQPAQCRAGVQQRALQIGLCLQPLAQPLAAGVETLAQRRRRIA